MQNERYDPWARGGRVKAIVGHYGSGKTELALNMAIDARERGFASMVVDLDIVNPFFRSAEQAEVLKHRGVEMIYPPFARTGVDMPVLPAEIMSVFERPELMCVFDVGGDDAGAAALGRYKPQFDRHGCDLIYVVNVFRPFSETPRQIVEMISRISRRARLTPSGIVNNANLGHLTRPEHLTEGQRVLAEVTRETGVPVIAACAQAELVNELPRLDAPVFVLERLTRPEWMEG